LAVGLAGGAGGLSTGWWHWWLLKQMRAMEGFLRLFSWLNLFGRQ